MNMSMPVARSDYPKEIYDLFPLTFIYYKVNKSKERRQHIGFEIAPNGKRRKVYAPFKKSGTKQQNNYSYVSVCLRDPNDWGTIDRTFRHKGYSKIIAAVYSTDDELEQVNDTYRYVFNKFKTISEIFNFRKVDDPEWKVICDRLEKDYPTRSTGQLFLL